MNLDLDPIENIVTKLFLSVGMKLFKKSVEMKVLNA